MIQPPTIVNTLIHAATALEDAHTADLAEQLDMVCSTILAFDTEHHLGMRDPEQRRWITALYETEARELTLAAVIWQLRTLANEPALLATLLTRATDMLEQRLFPSDLNDKVKAYNPRLD